MCWLSTKVKEEVSRRSKNADESFGITSSCFENSMEEREAHGKKNVDINRFNIIIIILLLYL